MLESQPFCKDICPLVAGNADSVEKINEETSFRKKGVKLDGKIIGYLSVFLPTNDFMGHLKMTTKEKDEIAIKGIGVSSSSIACIVMRKALDHILEQKGGAFGGGLQCDHTTRVDNVSTFNKPEKEVSIEL